MNYNGGDALHIVTTDDSQAPSPPVADIDDLAITVAAVNDAPTVTSTAVNVGFTELPGLGAQGFPAPVFSAASTSTIDAGQTITSLKFTVSGLVDGADEQIMINGVQFALVNGATGVTTGLTYVVSVVAGTATVTLTSVVGIAAAVADTVLNSIRYIDMNTDNPTPGDRVFTLTEIKDSGHGQWWRRHD